MKKLEVIDILGRIIAFPFFATIGLISALILWFKWIINYIKYGGESIAYTKKTQRKTIFDVFNKLNSTESTEKGKV